MLQQLLLTRTHIQKLMPGVLGEVSEVFSNVRNETVDTLVNGLPASKAELHLEVGKLQAENAKLEAQHVEEKALINSIILQVNKLTPVSFTITSQNQIYANAPSRFWVVMRVLVLGNQQGAICELWQNCKETVSSVMAELL